MTSCKPDEHEWEVKGVLKDYSGIEKVLLQCSKCKDVRFTVK